MSKFIENKIDEHFDAKRKIDLHDQLQRKSNKSYLEKLHDSNECEELYVLHIDNNFYHNYYAEFKLMHDVIKIDKCAIKEATAENINTLGLFLYNNGRNSDLKKALSKEEYKKVLLLFKTCYEKIINLIDVNQDFFQLSCNVQYGVDEKSGIGLLSVNNFKIKFEGDRAKILNYFFQLKDFSEDFKSFKEIAETEEIKLGSVRLRQDVSAINDRVKNETGNLIKQVIEKMNSGKEKELNFYRWKIIV